MKWVKGANHSGANSLHCPSRINRRYDRDVPAIDKKGHGIRRTARLIATARCFRQSSGLPRPAREVSLKTGRFSASAIVAPNSTVPTRAQCNAAMHMGHGSQVVATRQSSRCTCPAVRHAARKALISACAVMSVEATTVLCVTARTLSSRAMAQPKGLWPSAIPRCAASTANCINST